MGIMFLEAFKITSLAMVQIFLLGAIGYFLIKKNILGSEGLNSLSRLVIEITLPILIFHQLIKNFNFTLYPDWWIFPLLSILITLTGLIIGVLFIGFIRGIHHRLQFLSLITFQNSGYLPLALVSVLLPKERQDSMFIYLFLFLLGFNLVIWSFGVYMLTFSRIKRFELSSLSRPFYKVAYDFVKKGRDLFSPPVIAVIFSLMFIFLGLNKFVPEVILRPLRMIGDCTLPIALLVVGGNLAQIRLRNIYKRAIFLLILIKLILMPFLGIVLIMRLKLPELVGLLIVMQLAMPPAISLSVIMNHYRKEDLIISQGIFFGHIISIATIPIFLSLYRIFVH